MSTTADTTNLAPAPARAVVVPGVRLTFPTGRVLVLGEADHAEPLDVRKVGTRWCLGVTDLTRATEAVTMGEKKAPFHGCVFIRPNAASATSPRSWHAILDAELLLVEGHNTDTSLKVMWERNEAAAPPNDKLEGSGSAPL